MGSDKLVTTKAIMGILSNNGQIDIEMIEYTWYDEYTGKIKRYCEIDRTGFAKGDMWSKDCDGISRYDDFIKSNDDHW